MSLFELLKVCSEKGINIHIINNPKFSDNNNIVTIEMKHQHLSMIHTTRHDIDLEEIERSTDVDYLLESFLTQMYEELKIHI